MSDTGPDQCPDPGPRGSGACCAIGADRRVDPQKVHREFPERWSAYIRQNFRNLKVVERTFNVSERTARKWWNGETGCVGGHVAVAVIEHPVEAPRMLFAAE